MSKKLEGQILPKQKILTLTTDFGNLDGYVGIIKGIILSIFDDIHIIDLSHDIPPWNVPAAAWVLGNSCKHFPEGTIHLAVVDPGVGSSRRPIFLSANNQYFFGPDNGIFSHVINSDSFLAYELTEKKYWLSEISASFHARDLFAPVVAHFASGVQPDNFGQKIDGSLLMRINKQEIKIKNNRIEGTVVYVDRFGNLITNINKEVVSPKALCQVGKKSIGRIGQTYSTVEQGTPIAFIGSHGYLEIAVSQGRADEKLDAGINTNVILFDTPGQS